MSLNPNSNVGHLYHDGNISNPTLVLDAKEKMRTREINAREAKNLDKYSVVIERAKKVCKRQNEWEQISIRKDLNSIHSKTPSLAHSLRHHSELMLVQSSKGARQKSGPPANGASNRSGSHSAEDLRKKVNVSSWSVYSHLVASTPNEKSGRHREECKTAPAGRRRSGKTRESCASSKTETLAKRADQVTKSLHNLYTKSFERKWKEKGMTVLDILNRNSREELEKALFVLRGTPTGDVIEDILREREHVSKPSSEKMPSNKALEDSDDMLKLSEDVFISNLGETVVKPVSQDKSRSRSNSDKDSNLSRPGKAKHSISSGSDSSGPMLIPDDGRKTDNNDTSVTQWNENPLTIGEVFEREDSFLLSSMMANPSEADDDVPTKNKWRDIFKAPELWRQGAAAVNKEMEKIKPVSIVTLTGKHRQTMLK